MCHSCTQSLCSAFFFLLLSSHLRFSRLLLVIDNISFAVAPAVCSGKVFSLSSLLSYQLPFSESRGRDNKGPLFLSLASYFPFRQHTFSVHYLRTSLYLSVPLCTSLYLSVPLAVTLLLIPVVPVSLYCCSLG